MQNPSQGENLSAEVKQKADDLSKAAKEKVASVEGVVEQFTKPLSATRPVQPPVTKDEKVYGALAYIPLISLVCIVVKPDSAFVRLHARQGLLLTIIFLLGLIFAAIVSLFGVIGQLFSVLLGLVPIACFVVGIYSMYLAMTGFWWKIPVLSSVADLIPVEMMAKVSKENITGQVGIAKNDYDNRQDTLGKESAENKPPVAVPPASTEPPK